MCSTNLRFSVGYVLCTRYVCTWYQPAEITSCEKHSMVVYIHEPYPWAQSVVARRYMEVTSWRPGAVDCTVWNEHHRTRFACRRPGPGAHRDIDRGKVPSAARVACIARSACTSLDQNGTATNKPFGTHRGTDCRICIDYTSIYYLVLLYVLSCTASRCHGG